MKREQQDRARRGQEILPSGALMPLAVYSLGSLGGGKQRAHSPAVPEHGMRVLNVCSSLRLVTGVHFTEANHYVMDPC